VASPPPDRVDGSQWYEGLQVYDDDGDREFDPHAAWKPSSVLPREGISPFGQPPPEKIVLDQWVGVPAVLPTTALTTAFTLIAPDKSDVPSNHFLSIPYPRPTIDGVELKVTGVNYHTERELDFRPRHVGAWIAVSFDRFWPPDRASADYVVAVEPLEAEARPVAIARALYASARLISSAVSAGLPSRPAKMATGGANTAPLAPYPIDHAW
jgi:hypothetical protein